MTLHAIAIAVFLCMLVAPLLASAADDLEQPRITGLSHVALFVKDVEQSRAFYKDYLGYAEPYSVLDEGGKLRLTFIKVNDLQAIELFPEREAGSDRLNHIALEVDDAEGMRAYLAAKGIKVPEKVPKGRIGNSNFTIRDPDGHGVEVVQYEPDGWTVREKGKHLPETRVAPRISHVGILVSDLERSQRFYRDLFGMTETWRGSRDGKLLSWVNMKLPDGEDYIELMLHDQPITPERRLIAHHICLELPDVPRAEQALKSRAMPPQCKAMTAMRVGRNGKRQINLFDPDGTRVEIMEPATADGKPVPPSTAPVPAPAPTTQPEELLR
jgi:catechol 2,3-dioxygenase-like lactoylglutathione lyase family enzyme